MKVHYKNCDIEVYKEKFMEDDITFYSVFTDDGYEVTSGFSNSADSVGGWLFELKEIIDMYNAYPNDWRRDVCEQN